MKTCKVYKMMVYARSISHMNQNDWIFKKLDSMKCFHQCLTQQLHSGRGQCTTWIREHDFRSHIRTPTRKPCYEPLGCQDSSSDLTLIPRYPTRSLKTTRGQLGLSWNSSSLASGMGPVTRPWGTTPFSWSLRCANETETVGSMGWDVWYIYPHEWLIFIGN